jgi:hypothetical protein
LIGHHDLLGAYRERSGQRLAQRQRPSPSFPTVLLDGRRAPSRARCPCRTWNGNDTEAFRGLLTQLDSLAVTPAPLDGCHCHRYPSSQRLSLTAFERELAG